MSGFLVPCWSPCHLSCMGQSNQSTTNVTQLMGATHATWTPQPGAAFTPARAWFGQMTGNCHLRFTWDATAQFNYSILSDTSLSTDRDAEVKELCPTYSSLMEQEDLVPMLSGHVFHMVLSQWRPCPLRWYFPAVIQEGYPILWCLLELCLELELLLAILHLAARAAILSGLNR